MSELNIQFYGIKRLPDELRKTFELPGDPFEDLDAQEVLQQLGIIHFRDDVTPRGLLIQVPDRPALVEWRGFDAFKFRAIVDPDTYAPHQWVEDDIDPDSPTYADYVKKYGDDYSWNFWNEPVHIVSISQSTVRIA